MNAIIREKSFSERFFLSRSTNESRLMMPPLSHLSR
jgi:hypothetical protein